MTLLVSAVATFFGTIAGVLVVHRTGNDWRGFAIAIVLVLGGIVVGVADIVRNKKARRDAGAA